MASFAAAEESITDSTAAAEEINVEPAVEDSKGEDEQPSGEPIICAMAESVDVSGKSWKRVAGVSAPPRTNVREFLLRNIDLSGLTTQQS